MFDDIEFVGAQVVAQAGVGALDMSGNVWEWCSTLYKPYPYRLDDGREGFEDSKNFRVLPGSSWNDLDGFLHTPCRFQVIPEGEEIFLSFRCARSLCYLFSELWILVLGGVGVRPTNRNF